MGNPGKRFRATTIRGIEVLLETGNPTMRGIRGFHECRAKDDRGGGGGGGEGTDLESDPRKEGVSMCPQRVVLL